MAFSNHGVDCNISVLDPTQLRLNRDAFGKLHVSIGNTTYEDMRPVRCYPLSAPSRYIGLFDAEDREIGLIDDLNNIDPRSRKILTEELELKCLVIPIRTIRAVESRHGVTTWQLETARGFRLVHVRDRSDIRRLAGRRVILTDVHGMRFEILDTDKLDTRSLALLEAEI